MLKLRFCFIWILVSCSSLALADAVDLERQAITVALLQEPPNLDSSRTTDLVSFFVLGHVQEGLVRYDRRGRIAPGVAERWEVEDDRLVFHLRSDARWNNGEPVTAGDFLYAWRLVNDPAYAAPYASIMYPIAGAEAVQAGELPVDALGVEAPDDSTLVVRLENPCGYCISLMVHPAFYPINRSFREGVGSEYGSEADRLLYNGPFTITGWTHGTRLLMRKNPSYWNEGAIALNEINVGYITEDNRTRLNLFRDGQIALAKLGAETVKDAAAEGLRLRTFASGGMAFLRFNARAGRPTASTELRRAIALVFDPEEFVNKVIGIPGYRPAWSLFPGWLQGVDDRFVAEYPPKVRPVDVTAARALVDGIRARDGALPELTLLTVTSPTGARIAEYFQGLLANRLGLSVKVDQQTFKQYLEKSRQGDFDMALSSWYPDFDDIATFADLLASWNANNRGGYANPDYDRAVQVVLRASNANERMQAAAALQRIIAEDVPVLPMAETGSAWVQHPQLRGAVRRVLGADPDYTFARVVGAE